MRDGEFMRKYETVGASASLQALGATGKAGDVIEKMIVTVATSGADGTLTIKDGSNTTIPLVPANTAVGVYALDLNLKSRSGAWAVNTGSACTAIAVGRFS